MAAKGRCPKGFVPFGTLCHLVFWSVQRVGEGGEEGIQLLCSGAVPQ
jgi:hypothetical protein